MDKYIYCQFYVSRTAQIIANAISGAMVLTLLTSEREWKMYSHVDFFLALYNLVILTIRTWAVCDRDRRMAIFLSTRFVVSFIASFIIEGFWLTTVESKYPIGCSMFISSNPLTKSNNRHSYFIPSVSCSRQLSSAP